MATITQAIFDSQHAKDEQQRQAAYATLFGRVFPLGYGWAERKLRECGLRPSSVDPEDAAVWAFAKVCERMKYFTANGIPKGWMSAGRKDFLPYYLRTLRNEVIEEIRRGHCLKRGDNLPNNDGTQLAMSLAATTENSPEENAMALVFFDELLTEVRKQLGNEGATLLLLLFNAKTGEIADELKESTPTRQRLLGKIRKLVRKQCQIEMKTQLGRPAGDPGIDEASNGPSNISENLGEQDQAVLRHALEAVLLGLLEDETGPGNRDAN